MILFLKKVSFIQKLNLKIYIISIPFFLQYIGITETIKQFAKNNMTVLNNIKLQNPILPNSISIYFKSIKGCKDFYNILNNNNEKPTSKTKWEQIYDISVPPQRHLSGAV